MPLYAVRIAFKSEEYSSPLSSSCNSFTTWFTTLLKNAALNWSIGLSISPLWLSSWGSSEINDERKGSLKKIVKKKHKNVRQLTKETWMWSLLSEEEIIIKVIKFSPLIPYRNIWRLVRKNCICIVWLNGLISSWITIAAHSSSLAGKNKTENDSRLLKNSRGNCDDEWNFCWGQGADISLFLQEIRTRKSGKILEEN